MLYLRQSAWLWMKKNDPSRLPPVDAVTQAMFDAGHAFEPYVESLFPEGVTLGFSDFDEYRIHFCLVDKEFRDRLFSMKRDFEGMAQLGKEMQEKRDSKHIYDAVKEIKKPKIAELIPLLSEPLEKEGYIEFHLDKPEMGRDV